MPSSAVSRQSKREREESGECPEEHLKQGHNGTPQVARDNEYMTCTCGSTIKRKGFKRHFYTHKHIDYLIPVLEKEAKEKEEAEENERRLQRAAARAARTQAEAGTRATSNSETDQSDPEEACSGNGEDEQTSSEDDL